MSPSLSSGCGVPARGIEATPSTEPVSLPTTPAASGFGATESLLLCAAPISDLWPRLDRGAGGAICGAAVQMLSASPGSRPGSRVSQSAGKPSTTDSPRAARMAERAAWLRKAPCPTNNQVIQAIIHQMQLQYCFLRTSKATGNPFSPRPPPYGLKAITAEPESPTPASLPRTRASTRCRQRGQRGRGGPAAPGRRGIGASRGLRPFQHAACKSCEGGRRRQPSDRSMPQNARPGREFSRRGL